MRHRQAEVEHEQDRLVAELRQYERTLAQLEPVSYTHLTLPTRDLVEISVVAVYLKKKQENREQRQTAQEREKAMRDRKKEAGRREIEKERCKGG